MHFKYDPNDQYGRKTACGDGEENDNKWKSHPSIAFDVLTKTVRDGFYLFRISAFIFFNDPLQIFMEIPAFFISRQKLYENLAAHHPCIVIY